MVRILFNPQHLSSFVEEHTISNISDYAYEYDNLIKALQNNVDYRLVVLNQPVLSWLKNLSTRFPTGIFIFENLDSRSALAKNLDIDIPGNVTNEDILQAGLLSEDIHPQPGYTFEDTVLAHFYAPIFTAKTFPFTQLVALFEVIEPVRWKSNQAIPLLARTLHTRTEEWKDKARSSDQRQLIDWFATNPEKLKSALMSFRVLQSYPSLGEALLGETFIVLKSMKLQLDDLQLDETKIPDTVLQVTYFLNNQQPKDPEELVSMLNHMSGLLTVEFETIEKILIKQPDWISAGLVDQIESKFMHPSRSLARRITAIRAQIRPPKPINPDIGWDIDTMLTWATDSYLPYQAWCSTQNQFDSDLFTIGDRFSEWLMQGWDNIHANSKRMVFNILPNKAMELNRTGVVNLVIVIDNLGWSFSEILRDLFQESGYFLADAEPYLAMVPSETEISKKCLLAGAVGYEAIDDKSYKGMIEKGWVPYFHDHSFRYISDIGGLSAVNSIDASTYVVNYLAVDKALHKSSDEFGMSHREHIHYLLEKLVENAVTFIEKHNLKETIRIHVVSDHGSTRIPAAMRNDLDPAFFKVNGFEARSHRYLTVSAERFATLADNLKLDCFFLPANDFLLPENVLCARRGNHFLPTDQDTYIHGGLLPEEMIVPYMVFEPATVISKDLTVLLKKTEFRYRVETVEMEIGNPNESAVEQIQVSLLNGNVESDPVRIGVLNAKKNTKVQIQARFKPTNLPEEQTTLHVRIRSTARGEQHILDVFPKITMKKFVEEKHSDIFEF